jgi:hypothetical protein
MQVKLLVTDGPHQGRSFTFHEHDTFIVGRATCAHFRLPQKDARFSRVHFMIEVNPPHCRLIDANSTNGTFVNGRRVMTADLHDGDVIKGGATVMHVSVADVSPSAAPPAPAPRISAAPTLVPQLRPAAGAPNAPAGRSAIDLLPADYLERIQNRPQTIAGYQLVDEIGRGTMGVVYLALREADQSVVAVKTITPDAASNEADCDRFLRETMIMAQLTHPNIVAFRGMGRSHGQLFFAMDFVPGRNLEMLLGEEGPLAVGRAVRLTCQLLSALDYAHAKGFVHRDVKPANVMVSRDRDHELVRLLDFGLARAYQASRLSGLTMTGDMGGTVPFMAPEQITHFREAKASVDLYSAAAILYYLLTRQHVFDFPREVGRQIAMLLQHEPIPILLRRPDLPAELASLIDRGLARNVEKRFATAAEMSHALELFSL